MRTLIKLLTAAHLFRVPASILALLIALPWIALGPASALLANLIRELSLGEVFAVSVATTLTAFSAVTAIHLILNFGDERLEQATKWFEAYRHWHAHGLGAIAMVPLLATVVYWSGSGVTRSTGACLAGIATGFAGAMLARAVQLLVTEPGAERPLVALLPAIPVPRGVFARGLRNRVQRELVRIPRWLGAGYLEYRGDVAVRLYSGHAFAMGLMAVSFLFYQFGGRHIPTLAYLMILILLSSWVLSALAFFADRYRIPVLTIAVLVPLGMAAISDTDHYFPVYPRPAPLPAPGAVLAKAPEGAAILVAVEGGGIQAAAWSARVLTGLEQEIPGFSTSVRLISGVSGGAVGAFYYGNAFLGPDPPDREALDRAWRNAMESSLDEVAWGMTNPDLQRAFAPLAWLVWRDRFDDRGRALERTFEARSGAPAGHARMLSDWARETASGKLPPVIFNATVVENGSPLVFSTTAYPPPGSRSVLSLDYDIAITTAVRLSATFPIVTPAARAWTPEGAAPKLHVVDGGYYDNLGIATLVDWLRYAMRHPLARERVRRLLVLELHSFPETAGAAGRSRSWLYQLHAPLDTILNMRATAQMHRAESEIELLQEAWRGTVDVHRLRVRFPGCEEAAPPLSWRLRSDQKRCIEQAWRTTRFDVADRVRAFLAPTRTDRAERSARQAK